VLMQPKSGGRTAGARAHEMRLRFLGAPHISKSSHAVANLPATCKEEVRENVEAEIASLSTPVNDAVPSARQLRQRKAAVGLWAIRRQKLERAQLRPRIVVHMSRLRGRRTAADFGTASVYMKRKPRRSLATTSTPHTVTTSENLPPDSAETRNVNVVENTKMDRTSGFKVERPEEEEAVENGEVQDNEDVRKPSGDAVNSRPKRHIMQKKMVSTFSIVGP